MKLVTGWKIIISTIAKRLQDNLGGIFSHQPQPARKVLILPFLGYGTPSEVHMKGRVVRDKGISIAKDNDSVWTNMVSMYKRYAAEPVAQARVQARFAEL